MKTLALSLLIPMALCNTGGAIAAAPAPAGAANPAPTSAAPPARGAAPATAPRGGAGAPSERAPVPNAQATLVAAPGSSVAGNLTLTSQGVAVTIRGEITGLSPGKEHGFHVHENGVCTLPDFKSAGEHFNPTKDPHGGPDSNPRHLGDIPNAKADANGRATIDVTVKGATIQDKDGGPNELLGKALVVHAMPDDYKTQPSGGSGDRIACGVIR